MMNVFKSPIFRLSIGLSLLTCCILLTSDFLGLMPNAKKMELQSRKILVESLAVQFVSGMIPDRMNAAEGLIRALVDRNESILSMAIRKSDNLLAIQYGDHEKHWTKTLGEKSTASHVKVPIFNRGERWGALEVRFVELGKNGTTFFVNSFYSYVFLVFIVALVTYSLFLKRAMLELDPGGVIPERVSNALNTLSEGLLILDEKARIVFSNEFFRRRTGLPEILLVGKNISDLSWIKNSAEVESFEPPWESVIAGNKSPEGAEVRLNSNFDESLLFKVNATPIGGESEKIRGVIVTFNDVTELEMKNKKLSSALGQLKQGQEEIARQNKELKILATRDPLTGCLNRRSFFDGLKMLIKEAKEDQAPLSCIMLDIDHFKFVNDNHGHAVGDKVIKIVVKILIKVSRPNDLIGRYGGEEFCVILPNTSVDVASKVAERMRMEIECCKVTAPNGEFNVTSSFGVTALASYDMKPELLVDQADKGLYVAKENGRNRVELWVSEDGECGAEHGAEHGDEGAVYDNQNDEIQDKSLLEETAVECDDNEIRENNGEVNDVDVASIIAGNSLALPTEELNISEDDHEGVDRESESECISDRLLMHDRIFQAIGRARRYETKIAILLLDIEEVRRINNAMGISVGDKFVKSICKRIKGTLRNTDSISVVGVPEVLFSLSQINSDELAILLPDIDDDELVVHVVDRIFSVLEAPSFIDGNELYLNGSIGVSIFPDDGDDSDALIASASDAMQEARQSGGRNNFQFASSDINKRANSRLVLESALHKAIELEEFVVYYQPKVNIFSGVISGMEALVRWEHPERGLVPPDEFIPLAESNGLISGITDRVISMVCNQLRVWQAAGYPFVPVAINLSPVEFRDENLARKIIKKVEKAGLWPKSIELEITESTVMEDTDVAIKTIYEFNNAGISLSLDDFGTGYCSYNYLKKFSVDKIKIDRSFITNFTELSTDAAIVNSMITLAKNLGLQVVAEGVETEEQLRFLRDLQCDQVQGYLISRPVSAEEATKLIANPSIIRRKTFVGMSGGSGGTMADKREVPAEIIGMLNKAP